MVSGLGEFNTSYPVHPSQAECSCDVTCNLYIYTASDFFTIKYLNFLFSPLIRFSNLNY